MIRKFYFLFLVFFSFFLFGQTNSQEHLTFKGIPIDGTLAEFTAKMKKSGFVYQQNIDGTAIFKGDFAGNTNVQVLVLSTNNLVSRVSVVIGEFYNWSTLSNKYFSLKSLLSDKYGIPVFEEEKFQTSIEPKDDQSKFQEVEMDRCKFESMFFAPNGLILLKISSNGYSTPPSIMLLYVDAINESMHEEKAKNDL